MLSETSPNSPSNDSKITTRELKNISPIGTKLRAFIEHKVITTVEEFEGFKKRNSDFADYLDDVFEELVEFNFVEVVSGKMVLLKDSIWATNDPTYTLKSVPELSKEIARTALTAIKNKENDPFLDFSVILHFADDPEVKKAAAAAIQKCSQELKKIAAMSSKRDKNKQVRVISFAGSILNEGGL